MGERSARAWRIARWSYLVVKERGEKQSSKLKAQSSEFGIRNSELQAQVSGEIGAASRRGRLRLSGRRDCGRILCVCFAEGNGADGTDGSYESDGTSETWEPRGIFQTWVTGLSVRGRWGAWFVLTGATLNLAG